MTFGDFLKWVIETHPIAFWVFIVVWAIVGIALADGISGRGRE